MFFFVLRFFRILVVFPIRLFYRNVFILTPTEGRDGILSVTWNRVVLLVLISCETENGLEIIFKEVKTWNLKRIQKKSLLY